MRIKVMQLGSWFGWLKKAELIELKTIDINEDPIRPDVSLAFRTQLGRKIYGLKHGDDIVAVMCFAFTNRVPRTLNELDYYSKEASLQAAHRAGVQGTIAVAYTVWSRKKGGGKKIVKEVYKMIKQSNHLNRLVTLSPYTEMATKFHLSNGAKLLQKNLWTQNFEYHIDK